MPYNVVFKASSKCYALGALIRPTTLILTIWHCKVHITIIKRIGVHVFAKRYWCIVATKGETSHVYKDRLGMRYWSMKHCWNSVIFERGEIANQLWLHVNNRKHAITKRNPPAFETKTLIYKHFKCTSNGSQINSKWNQYLQKSQHKPDIMSFVRLVFTAELLRASVPHHCLHSFVWWRPKKN